VEVEENVGERLSIPLLCDPASDAGRVQLPILTWTAVQHEHHVGILLY